jgi:hypothetical protein
MLLRFTCESGSVQLLLSFTVGVGQQLRAVLPPLRMWCACVLLAGGVGNNPASFAVVGRSNI